MRVTTPISTIHYLSPEILKVKLDDLVDRDKIAFYAFIKHHKEEDETKDHIHLYIIPNGQIVTEQLREALEEMDIIKGMPIRPLPFAKSKKFADWYLYSLHDRAYLMSKDQSRKFVYRHEDIITSSPDYLMELVHQIDYTNLKRQQAIVDLAKNLVPFSEVVEHGMIPVQQFVAYKQLYELVFHNALQRQKQTHDNLDPETGEVLEDGDEVPW